VFNNALRSMALPPDYRVPDRFESNLTMTKVFDSGDDAITL
jgi:hypothetical protein